MAPRLLVTGATGRLGPLVVERLVARGLPVRVLTRRPGIAVGLFGGRVEIREGDFSDHASLADAVKGIDRLFLLSPLSERLAEQQIAVAAAAERAGVGRVVKLSGSDWTIEPPGRSISGDAHGLVENWLAQSALEYVSLRPNAWMQVVLPPVVAQIRRGEPLAAPWGAGGIGLIDARDIADVAVHQLLAPTPSRKPLVLTGPQVVTLRDIAAAAGELTGRTLPVAPADRTPAQGEPESFEAAAVGQFMRLIAAGEAAQATGTVRRLLGRPPRGVAGYLGEELREVLADA